MTEKVDERRLSGRILIALTLALEQKDAAISDLLGRALELAMTRGSGGKDFVERREFTEEIKGTLLRLDALRKTAKG
ncbi:MAG: hypothetical protein K8R48_06125 [Alphaproteobacteria bacterium]|nr:hypothetical protein [Alphaproteobacteria bacterium]